MKIFFSLALALIFFIPPVFSKDKTFYTLENGSLSYKELISSPKTILVIWTTWCPSCRKELKRLTQKCIFFDGVEILLINTGERKSTVERFFGLKSLKDCLKRKIILDSDAYIADKFSVVGIPAFIFLEEGEPVYASHFLNQRLIRTIFKNE